MTLDPFAPRTPAYPTGSDSTLPFGDPCGRCGAASTHEHPRDRVCDCVPCPVCTAATGNLCGYCGGSLGCRLHKVTIEQHVESACTASPERRAEVDRR